MGDEAGSGSSVGRGEEHGRVVERERGKSRWWRGRWRRGMTDCWEGRAAGEEEISREGVELQGGERRGRKQGAAEAE